MITQAHTHWPLAQTGVSTWLDYVLVGLIIAAAMGYLVHFTRKTFKTDDKTACGCGGNSCKCQLAKKLDRKLL